jgi:WD repeat-containing protein 35
MFVYLSKKIAIPNGAELRSLAWNSEQGWIACGGTNGLLKVVKLEGKATGDGAAQTNALSMNQALEGHNGNVMVAVWNENYRKLTTSDQNGLIIVWMLHKNTWFEEMINNRNRSVVRDMRWTADGQKICIVYEDGAVIVGGVDGTRLWGKELSLQLAFVEWSPSGRSILFGTTNGEVHLYDSSGNPLSRLTIYAVNSGTGIRLAGITWYNGARGVPDPEAPTLAIAYENGCVQITRHEADENPVLIDTGLRISCLAWSTTGSVLAIGGSRPGAPQSAPAQAQAPSQANQQTQLLVQFYTPYGKHLRTLKVPGNRLSALSWEGGDLRLALAVDSHIYFATVRPEYPWCFFANTLVYSFPKADRAERGVMFWNVNTDERNLKYVKKLIAVRAGGEHCVFATRSDAEEKQQFALIVCNAIGSPVDSRYVDIEPLFLAMTSTHVVAASHEAVYVWQYKQGKVAAAGSSAAQALIQQEREKQEGKTGAPRKAGDVTEVLFHIDDGPQGESCRRGPRSSGADGAEAAARMRRQGTPDLITAVAASGGTLVVSRASGALLRYSLPHVLLEQRHVVRCRPHTLAVNCSGSMLSVIDINGVVTLVELGGRGEAIAGFARKDAWDLRWSSDNPELFAVMEKTKMYVFRGLKPEEPVLSAGFICDFEDLCIRAAMLDDLMANPEQPPKELLVRFDTKSLRDTRQLLQTAPIAEAYQFVEDNAHPRLWRILAEAALEQLDFAVADKAFVRCADYQGVQFVKSLKLMNDRQRQKAEVAIYFRRFDVAETLFLNAGQRELAIDLRRRLGDWFRVVELLQQGGRGDERALQEAWNKIGEYYADRQKWDKALRHFAKGGNLDAMSDCAYALDDFEALRGIASQAPDGSPLLLELGRRFASVGLCAEAAAAFERGGDAQAAVDCCVQLNQWDMGVRLAEAHRLPQIEGLLGKYASYLVERDQLFEAVELFRKAGRHGEAARLLMQLARRNQGADKVRALRTKQLYVLAGLELERFRSAVVESAAAASASSAAATASSSAVAKNALQALMQQHELAAAPEASGSPAAVSLGDESPWHGAEAFHFFLLAQRQLYAGDWHGAMVTAMRLSDYEDVLEPRDVHCLVALAAFRNQHFGVCSRALVQLESSEALPEPLRAQFKELAQNVFVRHAPRDPKGSAFACVNPKCDGRVREWDTHCATCGHAYAACVLTGRALISPMTVTCRQCKHRMMETAALRQTSCCPLCHSRLAPRA